MAWLAWQTCKRARETKAFSLALFVGIPIIYEPFNFVFVFGGLDSNYSQLLFWAGLLTMTRRYLDKGEKLARSGNRISPVEKHMTLAHTSMHS
jgi:hypothetical protein